MKLPIYLLRILVISLATALVSSAENETLTNGSIVQLIQASFPEETIVNMIKTQPSKFDVGVNSLLALKTKGVSDKIINEMVLHGQSPVSQIPIATNTTEILNISPKTIADANDPNSPHDSGIYYYDEIDGKAMLTQLDPSVYNGSHGSVAFFAEYGQSSKSTVTIHPAHAELQISKHKPVFYFYFENTKSGLGYSRNEAVSPKEYQLAKFDIHSKDDSRSLVVGQFNAYAGSQTGADSKAVRNFQIEKISPGIYKVSLRKDLENGEYGFFYGGDSQSGKVFDFGIQNSLTNKFGDSEVGNLCASLQFDKVEDLIRDLERLQTMNAIEAVPAILPLLTNSDGGVICQACRTLAVLGDKSVIPSIEPLLKGSPNLKKNGPGLSIVAAVRRSNVEGEIKKEARDAIAKLKAKT